MPAPRTHPFRHADGREPGRRGRPSACGLKAKAVYVVGDFNHRVRNDAALLTRDQQGHWRGFLPGVKDRHRYMFYVVGEGRGSSAIPTPVS